MRLKIENWMRYAYDKPVGFSSHVVRLYPRTDPSIVTHRRQTVVNLESDIQYRRDLFDNLVANCFLPKPGEVLEIRVELELELWPKNPFHFLLAPHAVQLPFQYTSDEERILAAYKVISPEEQAETDAVWRLNGKRDTVSALVDLASTLHSEIAYEVRLEGEARLPAETIELRSGACRDTSLLCATILRKIGLAVRVVRSAFQASISNQRTDSTSAESRRYWWRLRRVPRTATCLYWTLAGSVSLYTAKSRKCSLRIPAHDFNCGCGITKTKTPPGLNHR